MGQFSNVAFQELAIIPGPTICILSSVTWCSSLAVFVYQLINEQITLINGQDTIIQSIYIDSTLGDDTKLTFSYSVDINVNVTTPDGQKYTITKDETLKLITVQIHGQVVSEAFPSKCLDQAKYKS